MPLYRFCVHTPEGSSEMELGFHADQAALSYAERWAGEVEIEVWRADAVPGAGESGLMLRSGRGEA
jgi:hypothetical protein